MNSVCCKSNTARTFRWDGWRTSSCQTSIADGNLVTITFSNVERLQESKTNLKIMTFRLVVKMLKKMTSSRLLCFLDKLSKSSPSMSLTLCKPQFINLESGKLLVSSCSLLAKRLDCYKVRGFKNITKPP